MNIDAETVLSRWLSVEEIRCMPKSISRLVSAILEGSVSEVEIAIREVPSFEILSQVNLYFSHCLVFYAVRRVPPIAIQKSLPYETDLHSQPLSPAGSFAHFSSTPDDPGSPSVRSLPPSTPLMDTTELEICSILELLKTSGLPLDRQDTLQQNPLFYAARDGRVNACNLLVRGGCAIAALDGVKQTPAYYAAREGRLEVLKLFSELEPGLDLDWTDKHNQTILFYACSRGRLDVVSWLLSRGVDVCRRDAFRKRARNYLPPELPGAAVWAARLRQAEDESDGIKRDRGHSWVESCDENVRPLKKRKSVIPPPPWQPVARELLRSALPNCALTHAFLKSPVFALVKKRLENNAFPTYADFHHSLLSAIHTAAVPGSLETEEFFLQLAHCSGLASFLPKNDPIVSPAAVGA